jgi:hypothetical protein
MRCCLHVLARDPERESLPDYHEAIRKCIANAPGILEVTSIDPHTRGGFSVIVDRVETLPDDFDDYFEHSELTLVI